MSWEDSKTIYRLFVLYLICSVPRGDYRNENRRQASILRITFDRLHHVQCMIKFITPLPADYHLQINLENNSSCYHAFFQGIEDNNQGGTPAPSDYMMQ
jgi:hypothetical protein